MIADPVIFGLRIYVVAVSTLVAILGTCQIRRWTSFLVENQLAWLAVAAYNFAAWYGCLDQLIHHGDGGSRTYVVAVASTFALYASSHWPMHQLIRWWRARRLIHRTLKEKS